MAYLVGALGRSCGTVKGKVMAMRAAHLSRGLRDPLLGKERLWMTLRGLKRLSPETARKFPATVDMLRWIRDNLSPFDHRGRVDRTKEPGTGSHEGDTVLWASVTERASS